MRGVLRDFINIRCHMQSWQRQAGLKAAEKKRVLVYHRIVGGSSVGTASCLHVSGLHLQGLHRRQVAERVVLTVWSVLAVAAVA